MTVVASFTTVKVGDVGVFDYDFTDSDTTDTHSVTVTGTGAIITEIIAASKRVNFYPSDNS